MERGGEGWVKHKVGLRGRGRREGEWEFDGPMFIEKLPEVKEKSC